MGASDRTTSGFVPTGEGRAFAVLGDRISCKVVGAETGGSWELFEVDAPAGGSVPFHRHAWAEAYYVLDGKVEFQLAASALALGTGSFVHVPGGTPHALRNASASSARYLLWTCPAGAEGFFAELDRAAREDGFGLEKILAVAARHGIEALPPPA